MVQRKSKIGIIIGLKRGIRFEAAGAGTAYVDDMSANEVTNYHKR